MTRATERLAAIKQRLSKSARPEHKPPSFEVAIPVRAIVGRSRKANGDFVQPRDDFSAEREVVENKNRLRYASHFNFADPYTGNTRTHDPEGNYNCGRCNQYDASKCLLLDVASVDGAAGSCEDWENRCAGDPELILHRKTVDAAVYGVAKNGKGFGCHRCGHAERALRPDSVGRELYCGDGDFRTYGTACCSRNSAPVRS